MDFDHQASFYSEKACLHKLQEIEEV